MTLCYGVSSTMVIVAEKWSEADNGLISVITFIRTAPGC